LFKTVDVHRYGDGGDGDDHGGDELVDDEHGFRSVHER